MKERRNTYRVWTRFVVVLSLLACLVASLEAQALATKDSKTLPYDLLNALHLDAGSALKGPALVGGQPSANDLDRLGALGYKTVVNLRAPAEQEQMGWSEAEWVEALGMNYVSIPVAGAAGLTADNARRLGEVLDDEANYPVLVHCAGGNRVGGLLALKAFHVDGLDAAAALLVGTDSGLTSLQPVVAQHLEKASSDN